MNINLLYSTALVVALLLVTGFNKAEHPASGEWEHPLKKMGYLNTPLVEVEPFVWNDAFYLLENWRSHWEWPGQPGKDAGKNNEMWIARLPGGPEHYEDRVYISRALSGNTLGTAIAWQDRLYVFAVNEESDRKSVDMTWSTDLVNWSQPVKVFDSPAGKIFNVSVARDDKGFVFLWESNGVGRPFTMCFGRVESLTDNWNEHIIDGAVYGEHKYTGGPAVEYADGWYYLLYAESLPNGWETRIARSRDLEAWEDAPEDRPFVTFDSSRQQLPLHEPGVREKNATDPALTYYQGRVVVYFTGGIQKKGGDLQWAVYDGTVSELLQSFFTR